MTACSPPRSLVSTTLARLAGLPSDARALSSALAVVNQRVPLGVAGRVAGLAQATQALEGLLATGFVRWWPAEAQTPVEFAHPLYRVAAYDDLSPQDARTCTGRRPRSRRRCGFGPSGGSNRSCGRQPGR